MADNINVTPGVGKTIAADEIATVLHQRVKVVLGNDGINDGDISSTNPMPVTMTTSPLPTDAATETTLSDIDSKIVHIDTGAVVVSSSALPTGAATAANQASGNASLASIDGKIVTINTGAVIVASSALPTGAATESTLASLNAKVTTVNTGAVVVASSALPTGASTEATLSSLNAKVVHIDTGAVVVSSSALPTGAATAANQASGNASLASIDSKLNSLGQKTMAGSVPVTLASDQSAIPVTGPLTDAQLRATPVPVSGTITTSPDVNIHDSSGNPISSTGTSLDVNVTNTVPVTGPLTNAQLRASAVPVDGSGFTQPISAVSLPLPTGASTAANQATGNASLSSIDSKIVHVDTGAVVVSSSALPTGAATAANQATGNASLASIDSKLNSLGQKTMANSVPVTIASDQSALPVSQSGSWSVTANAGTNLNTSLLALDTTVSALQVAQGSTTSGQNGGLIQGAVTTAAPSYTTGKTNPLSLTTAGALRVDGSAVTQPISASALPLPTGAATSANQATEIASLASIDSKLNSLGQKTMANSVPVAIASDQSAIPVTGPLTDTQLRASAVPVTANAGTNLNTSLLALDSSVNPKNATGVNTRVAVNTSTTQLLAANANRKSAYIFNQSGATLFIKLGDPAVVNQGIRLPNFAMYEITMTNLWTGAVNAISSAGTNTLDVFEGTP